MSSPITKTHHLPLIYWLFFAYVEPFEAINGAFMTHFLSHTYYTSNALMPASVAATTTISPATQIVLSQLATMYLGFGLTEIVITRLCGDIRVWRAYVAAQVVSDLCFLYSMRPLGLETYWRADLWNLVAWGDFGILYVQLIIRLAFLAGWGVRKVGGKVD